MLRWPVRILLSLLGLGMFSAPLLAQLHSVDEAISRSKETGQPILAVAGQKT